MRAVADGVLFRLEAERRAVLPVDVIHLAKMGGIEGAAGQALRLQSRF